MKKLIVILTFIIAVLGTVWMLNSVKPLDDILGCYKSVSDKICIFADNTYQQQSTQGTMKNNGKWRSFKYNAPEGEFTALVFYDYLTTSNERSKEMEAQPQSNHLGRGYFHIPESLSPNSSRLEYVKEEDLSAN